MSDPAAELSTATDQPGAEGAGAEAPAEGQQPPAGQAPAEGQQGAGQAPAEGQQPPAEGGQNKQGAEGEPDGAGTESETLLSDDGGSGSDGEDSKEAEAKAPEKYEFNPPEGVEVSEDAQNRISEFAENVARKLDLSQEQFQGLMEHFAETQNSQRDSLADKYMNRITEWQNAARNDKELGGENLDANVAVAKEALSKFGSQELGKIIDAPGPNNPEGLGLGNHPEFLRFVYRVGKAVSEGQLITGAEHRNAGEGEQERLRRYYPSMFPNDS